MNHLLTPAGGEEVLNICMTTCIKVGLAREAFMQPGPESGGPCLRSGGHKDLGLRDVRIVGIIVENFIVPFVYGVGWNAHLNWQHTPGGSEKELSNGEQNKCEKDEDKNTPRVL